MSVHAMLKRSQRRRNAFYRKARKTSKQCNLSFVDTVDLYRRMAGSKRVARLSARYGTTTLWGKAERRDRMPWISVPILLHVKNEIVGWRIFFNEDELLNASEHS